MIMSWGPDNYRACLARAKRALSNGTFSTATLSSIEDDISSTLPSLHIFHPQTGPLYQDLKDMLCAWVVSRSDEGLGYKSGIAKIAAMFLINMSPQHAFVVMRNLLERHCMRSFYGGPSTKDDVRTLYCLRRNASS
jgi:TBC1 domain family member 14